MAEPKYCPRHGYLVCAGDSAPSDPREAGGDGFPCCCVEWDEGDDRALAVARAEALAGRGSGALYGALAAADTDWFLLNARHVAPANPGLGEEVFDSFLRAPAACIAGVEWRKARDWTRVTIAETITLDEALERTSCPLATWDCNERYSVRLRLFATSEAGAMLMKSGGIEPKELENWNERARARGGRVGASHTHSEVVWMFEDDDCGIWNQTRRLVRGDRERVMVQGRWVSTGEIRSIVSFVDATPEEVDRGVCCRLASGEEILIHAEHDDNPPTDPDYSGEAVHWESSWVWDLGGDLATWLGVPHTDRSGMEMNPRQLEARARLLAFADVLEGRGGWEQLEPTSCGFRSFDGEDLSLRWAPETGVLSLFLAREGRTWEWAVKRGPLPAVVRYLRHFITPRRLLARARGGY